MLAMLRKLLLFSVMSLSIPFGIFAQTLIVNPDPIVINGTSSGGGSSILNFTLSFPFGTYNNGEIQEVHLCNSTPSTNCAPTLVVIDVSSSCSAGIGTTICSGSTTLSADNSGAISGLQENDIIQMGAFQGGNFIASTSTFVAALLPVELQEFNIQGDATEVVINWVTASEVNNELFKIERSIDGITFEEIGKVSGSGTTTQQKAYSFKDRSPVPGLNYYRLKQVDFDEQTSYSKVLSHFVSTEWTGDAELFPNPSNGQTSLFYQAAESGSATIQVLDLSGKELNRYDRSLTKGMNNLEFDLSHLNKGIYLVRLNNNNQQITTRLSIQ